MSTDILNKIQYNDGIFPRQALLQAIEQRNEITPKLLEILEYTIENAERLAEDENYMAHIYALFLLAQFREKKAYPLICSLLNKPSEIVDQLLGDTITEGIPSILASVYDGDLKPLKNIIENDKLDEFIRSSALYALVVIVAQGITERDEIITYFKYLFNEGLKRKPSYVWDALANCCYDLYPEETIKDIELAYKENLIDSLSIGFDEIEEQLSKGKRFVLNELQSNSSFQLIDDTIRELEWWACFNKKNEKRAPEFRENTSTYPSVIQKSQPHWVEPKVGRNDPCPCGSGKKYKKCCGKNV